MPFCMPLKYRFVYVTSLHTKKGEHYGHSPFAVLLEMLLSCRWHILIEVIMAIDDDVRGLSHTNWSIKKGNDIYGVTNAM